VKIKEYGFAGNGVISSVSLTPAGTVLIMRARREEQVEAKKLELLAKLTG
jgi:hypothetical protein